MDQHTGKVDDASTESKPFSLLEILTDPRFSLFAKPPSNASFNVASFSSTPPTSVSPDDVSLASDQDAPTPKAAAVPCLALDKPALQALRSPTPARSQEPLPELSGRQQQVEGEAGPQPESVLEAELELPRVEPPVSSVRHDKSTPEPQPEGQSEATTKPSSEPNVQAQLERQLEHETELGADANPEPHQQAPADEPPATIVVATTSPARGLETLTTGRSRRARASLATYNLSKLFGTDIHGRRASKGDDVKPNKRRRTVAGGDVITDAATASAPVGHDSQEGGSEELGGDATDAVERSPSVVAPETPKGAKASKNRKDDAQKAAHQVKPEIVTRRTARLSGTPVPNAVTLPLSSLAKRGKKAASAAENLARCKRELRRLQDTNEFAHVDERPILTTVWSNGKFVDPRTLETPAGGVRASKRVKTVHVTEPKEEPEKPEEVEAVVVAPVEPEAPELKKRTAKLWLDKGLYAGQPTPADLSACLTTQEKKKLAQVPELTKIGGKTNKALPPPMFNGLRLLLTGRDFHLPYDVCNPLPPGHPKPPTYRSLTKNRFVGEAGLYWKKQKHMDDLPSKCVCKSEDGCAEDCQNRIMLYECDDTNCNVGREHCGNRPFATLSERTREGGRYRVGVEVFKTGDRGFGVRSNRCFRPHQIIMEYTGEIITEDECLHRMDTVYKNNECYYLMSFASNIVIDATTGSIARFVNHSCSPNCRMIKWIVSGQPRMALFAGDRPIMTGEELTYDYNFAPYSKDPQKCLCGADNCRGVLGPKPRDVKVPKEPAKTSTLKAAVKAGKRKLKELLGGEEGGDNVYDDVEGASKKLTKKRKIGVATGASSLSKSSLKVAKGAADALKRSVSSVSLSAKAALGSKSSTGSVPRASTGEAVKATVKKGSPGRPRLSGTAAEAKAITSSKAAVAVALASLGIASGKKVTSGRKKASTSSSASQTIVAKPPMKAASSSRKRASKPVIIIRAKSKTTKVKSSTVAAKAPTKASSSTKGVRKRSVIIIKAKSGTTKDASAAKRVEKHSGYTPPGSPKDGPSQPASVTSSRKKTPSRKILESAKVGSASVTKPKPATKVKPKAKKLAAVSKKQRDMLLSMVNTADSESTTNTSSAKEPKKSTKKRSLAAEDQCPSPSAPLASIRAVAASSSGTNARPSTPAKRNKDADVSSPLSVLSSVQSTPELSLLPPPELGPASRSAMVTLRVPQIRAIQRDLDDN